jgi:EmrB/QacA subfamily drug resistance transporter
VPYIVAAAFFMETLDASIIVTALPSIAASFGESTLAMTQGISVYLLTVAVLVPTAGWVSDRFGARNVFACAVAVFTLASLLCGLSPSFWSFMAARALQGAAAAFMSPVGRLVVLNETPKHRILESLSLIVWPGLIGPVLGPPLGGWIATYASWHWIFFVNLPIGLVGLWLVLRFVPKRAPKPRKPFDGAGFVLTAGALVALIHGLSMLAEAPDHRLWGVALAAAGLILGTFAARRAWHHPAPLVDLQATREPIFTLGTLKAGLLGRVGINAVPFLLPLMFQLGFKVSPLNAGLIVLFYMAGNLVMKFGTTALLRLFGFRKVLVVNGLLSAVSILACSFITPAWPLALMAVPLVAAGMTRSMQFTALNTVGFAEIPEAARTGASTLAAMAFQVSAALAVAVGTLALAVGQWWAGRSEPVAADFQAALWFCSFIMAASSVWLLRLPGNAGHQALGRG